MSPQKEAIWFAKGFAARTRAVDLVVPAKCELDQRKLQKYLEGWEHCHGLFQFNLEPYTPAEMDERASFKFAKARKL